MAQSRTTLGLLTVVIIFGALGYWAWDRLRPETEATEETEELSEAELEVVESVQRQFNAEVPTAAKGDTVVRDTLSLYVSAEAQAQPYREARLLAQVAGIVQLVRVRENQEVRAGELLVRIDTTEYAMDLATREAALEKAWVDYEVKVLQDEVLQDTLVRQNRARLARIISGLPQAENEVERAKINLQKTAVRAPFGGRIADLKVVAGQHVGAGTELLTVIDIDPIKVSVQALEMSLVDLEEGRAASLEFTALPDSIFWGVIESINPIVDATANTSRVTVVLPNPDARIKPGMHARAQLEAQKIPGLQLAPRSAIRETPDRRTFIFIFKDGRSDWRYVTPGRMNDDLFEILPQPISLDKVDDGEIVLVDGHQSIIHNAAIRLVENVAAAGGRPTR